MSVDKNLRFLFILFFLPFVSAEYFETELTINFNSYTDNITNETFHNLSIRTENPLSNFTKYSLTNTSNFEERFKFSMWREPSRNITQLENITNHLESVVNGMCIDYKAECDYLKGVNSSLTNITDVYRGFFQNADYKSQFDVCNNERTSWNTKFSEAESKAKQFEEDRLVWAGGAALLALLITYNMWKRPYKGKQPGEKEFPDIASRGGSIW